MRAVFAVLLALFAFPDAFKRRLGRCFLAFLEARFSIFIDSIRLKSKARHLSQVNFAVSKLYLSILSHGESGAAEKRGHGGCP